MIHPTNPLAIRVKRDGPRGWHWIAPENFDPSLHEKIDPLDHDADGRKGGANIPPVVPVAQPEVESEAPAVEPAVKSKAKRRPKRKGK